LVSHQYVNQPIGSENILDVVTATDDTFLQDLSVSVPLATTDQIWYSKTTL